MQHLAHSPLLLALGYALIYSIGQFSILWLVYFLLDLVFKLSTTQKYVSAVVTQLTGFGWFIGTIIFGYSIPNKISIVNWLNLMPNTTGNVRWLAPGS